MSKKLIPLVYAFGIYAYVVLTAQPLYAQNNGLTSSKKMYVIEEIVVSARKREESWKDVPIAVTAFSADRLDIAKVENSEDLIGRTPSLFISNGDVGSIAGSGFLVIRGVGATPIIEPAVGTFLDGVYQTAINFDMDFMDIEQVEILRGPQGTLFGRNTQGGALNIISKKPSEEMSGKVRVGYDEFNTLDVQAGLSGPVNENLLFSVSARYKDSDGYVDNATLGKDQDYSEQTSGRLRLYYTNSRVTADFNIYGSDWSGGDITQGISESGLSRLEVFDSEIGKNSREHIGTSFKFDVDFDNVMLTSITGYNDVKNDVFHDIDKTALPDNIEHFTLDHDTFSQEIRLSSNSDSRLRWSAGGFYFDEQRALKQFIDNNTFSDGLRGPGAVDPIDGGQLDSLAGINYNARYAIAREGYAVFGQFDVDINDKWSASGGVRYSEEDAKFDVRSLFQIDLGLAIPPAFGPPPLGTLFDVPGFDLDAKRSASFSATTWMGSITYAMNEDVSFYSTVAKGFKSGGYQDFILIEPEMEPFDNEFSTNYEIGVKASLLEGRMNLNFAAYYIDIQDQQIKVRKSLMGIPANETVNIGESHTQGLELETTVLLSEEFTFNGAVGWIHEAEFDKVDATLQAAQNATVDLEALNGFRFAQVPEWTGSLSLNYERELQNDMRLNIYGDFIYVSDYTSSFSSDPTNALTAPTINDYSYFNISAKVEKERWAFSVFVENLLDDDSKTNTNMGSFFNTEVHSTILTPRRIGVSFELRM
jgi:iron complex outermembrane recepter protein